MRVVLQLILSAAAEQDLQPLAKPFAQVRSQQRAWLILLASVPPGLRYKPSMPKLILEAWGTARA
jgi:hypothetical protein